MECIILSKFENHPNYNCKVTLDNGEEYLMYANWLHNEKLDSWQGWHCNAGATRFYIDKDFNLWDGECKNTNLGSVFGDWNVNTNTTCSRKTCTGCTDDLMTAKHDRS
jgi:hypothetical protein